MKSISMKDAVWAGVIAGLIFVMLEMMMVPLFLGGSPWGPPRMIAAIILGEGVLPPPATFDFGVFITAVILHLILSIVYAIILAWIISAAKTSFWVSILIGAVLGYVLYLVNFYVFTGVFPWFANARNWVSAFAHISFGVAAAWSYVALAAKHTPQHETSSRKV